MFNKPSVFSRNEPITRRDVQSVLGTGSKSSAQGPDSNAAKNPNVTKVPGSNQPPATHPAQSSMTGDAPVPDTLAVTKESTNSENIMGARLIVGPDVKLKGAEILDCDTLVVEGRVEATMDSRVIRIAENGSFSGKVSIDIAEIHGTFEGELTARSQLIIHSTGRVNGTIRFGKLVVDEGGELCGEINVLSEKATPKPMAVVEPFLPLSAAAG
jgi:cytoskeletal protein CcmA (bactofilin family)